MSKELQKQRNAKRNDEIKALYWKLKERKKDKIQIYSNDFIVSKIANKYFLAPLTIEKIIFSKHSETTE